VQNTQQNSTVKVHASPRERCAFTLIELLVVVAIIAAVGSVGVGLYAGTLKRLQVERTARDFLLTARYARIMAIEKQREYKILIGNDQQGGFYLTTMQLNDATGQVEQTIVNDYYCKPVQFEGAVEFEDVQIVPTGSEQAEEAQAEQTITFSPNGTAQAVVVQIGDGRTHYTVSIAEATGKAKISYGELENAEIGTIDLDAQ